MKMNNEMNLFYEYSRNNIKHYTQSDKKTVEEIAKHIGKLFPFERPDMILPMDNQLLFIEQFEFDASKYRKKKGNIDKIDAEERNRDFATKITNRSSSIDPITSIYKVNTKNTLENFLHNFQRTIINHISKISDYKDNIITSGYATSLDQIKSSFFIIDTSFNTNQCIVNNELKDFHFFWIKEFVDILENTPELNYVFSGYSDSKGKHMDFISNTEESRKFLKSLMIDFDKYPYITFETLEWRGHSQFSLKNNDK